MKILEQPNPQEWRSTATCHCCTTKVELEINDVRCMEDPRDGGYLMWVCPVCNATNNETLDKVPSKYRYALQRR